MSNRVDGSVCEVVHENERLRFFVADPADEIQLRHYQGGLYEVEELKLMSKFIRPYSTILEVGTNVGNHCIYFDRFLDPKRLIVVEPNPVSIEILKINLLLNEARSVDTRFLGVGLGDNEAQADLAFPWPNNLGATELRPNPEGAVRVVRGDSLFAGEKIDFIKVDVEGMELEVLRGLASVIASQRPAMFVEIRDVLREPFEQFLESVNYRIESSYRRYEALENFLILPGV